MKRHGVLTFALLLMVVPVLPQEAKFVLPLPPESELSKQSIRYAEANGKALQFDLYRPRTDAKLPVAIMLNGVGGDWMRGHAQYTGWGKAVTTVGLAGVTMDSVDGAIEKNFEQLMTYVRAHATELKIDPEQVVLFSCSSNVKTGLPIVSSEKRPYIKGAVIYYGTGETPTIRHDLPVMVVRAGLDSPQLNSGISEMTARAVKENAPWSLVNFAGGQHGFDIFDDNDESRAVVRATLDFMKMSLDAGYRRALLSARTKAEAAGFVSAERWPEAVAAYEKMMQADPSDSMVHWRLAQALAHSGQERRAVDEYQKALELGNRNVGMISLPAAKLSLKIGDKDRALAFVERVKGIKPVVELLRTDKDFDPLRQDPKFQAVIESVPRS